MSVTEKDAGRIRYFGSPYSKVYFGICVVGCILHVAAIQFKVVPELIEAIAFHVASSDADAIEQRIETILSGLRVWSFFFVFTSALFLWLVSRSVRLLDQLEGDET